MEKLLDGALNQLQVVIATLNADQQTIDSLTSQLASVQAAKEADDAIIAAETVMDRRESINDYLRGKGRAIREGAILIVANEQENFNVPLSDIDSEAMTLVMQGFTNAGFTYTVMTL